MLSRGAFGDASHLPRSVAATEGTPYDLASLTKPLATALLAVLLEQEGRLDLDAPVAEWIDELHGSPYETVSLARARSTPRRPSRMAASVPRGLESSGLPVADRRRGAGRAAGRGALFRPRVRRPRRRRRAGGGGAARSPLSRPHRRASRSRNAIRPAARSDRRRGSDRGGKRLRALPDGRGGRGLRLAYDIDPRRGPRRQRVGARRSGGSGGSVRHRLGSRNARPGDRDSRSVWRWGPGRGAGCSSPPGAPADALSVS